MIPTSFIETNIQEGLEANEGMKAVWCTLAGLVTPATYPKSYAKANMKRINPKKIVLFLVVTLICGCSIQSPVKIIDTNKISVEVLDQIDFGYFLTHAELLSESPLPYERTKNQELAYRIYGLTEQGSCVGGCPASTLFVVLWNYSWSFDGNIKVYKINGIRFFEFEKIVKYGKGFPEDSILSFSVLSRNARDETYRYVFEVHQSYIEKKGTLLKCDTSWCK